MTKQTLAQVPLPQFSSQRDIDYTIHPFLNQVIQMIDSLIEKHMINFRADSLLDVGLGYNHFSRVADDRSQVTYLDYDEFILDWQVAECEKQHLAATTLKMSLDIADLSQISGRYDLILGQEIIEHLPNAE